MLTLLLSIIKPQITIRQAVYLFNRYNFTRRKYIWLFKKAGMKIDNSCRINRPFFIDNKNIETGTDVFINSGCTLIATGGIKIGNNVLIAPGVKICTANHAMDPVKRLKGEGSLQSVTIGNNVWIGAGAIILPGVTIADNCVIGAGSVVTRSTAPDSLYAGNPAVFKKKITS